MLKIRCINNMQTKEFPIGTSLVDVLKGFPELECPYPIVSAKVNNVSQGLKFKVYQNRDVEFVDLCDPSGFRVYVRSLCFIVCKAAQDVIPKVKVFFEHSLSGGYFFNLRKPDTNPVSNKELEAIKQRVKEIIDENRQFHRIEALTEEAIQTFKEQGFPDKVKLFETSGQLYTDYYTLGGTADYYYGCLVPSTGYITLWDIERYERGFILRVPNRSNPLELAPMETQSKTFEVFNENVKWNVIMRQANAGDVNKQCLQGHASELIQVSEALQEKKIVKIAEEIDRRYRSKDDPIRIVLITGPSSSGKTTFCKRLSVQLLACGLRPISFSTDDYFVNRVDTPKLPNGQYDFDNIKTVDTDLLCDHLSRLMKGEKVEVPTYNFTTGMREYNGKKLQLNDYKILIVEGIHALNPILTQNIDDKLKYKIFISALTSVSLDDHNWIPTSDNRLLRRIVRDYNKGAFSARETIAQWPQVCAAEREWIRPYQETADVMFNSALNIEFAVLRNHAEPILASVPKNCHEYAEAHRLLKFIHYFVPIPDKEIPPTSIMREFVGGSSFKY